MTNLRFDKRSLPGDGFKICFWNVEGLTDAKIVELTRITHDRNISISCLQEVRRSYSEYFVGHDGHLIIVSGSSGEEREWAGMGFIEAPWLRKAIVGFMQVSNRLCTIKMKTKTGKLSIINACAPHNAKPHDERQKFFADLGDIYERPAGCDVKIFVGDLNARIGQQQPGEERAIGPFTFGRMRVNGKEGEANRDLLTEMCVAHSLTVANTFQNVDEESRVTFWELGVPPMSEIAVVTFAQLDLLLVPQWFLPEVRYIASDRSVGLASQHFLVEAILDCSIMNETTSGNP